MTDIGLYDEPDRKLSRYDYIEAAWIQQKGIDSVVDWCYLTEYQRRLYQALLDAGRRVPDLACRYGPR